MTTMRLGEEKAVNGELPSLEITLAEVNRRLDGQFEQVKNLDWKASLSLGTGIVTIAATANLFPRELASLSSIRVGILAVALLFILLSVGLAVFALWVRTYHRPPNPHRLRDYYIDEKPEVTKLIIIDTCLDDIDRNEKPISQKVKLVQSSHISLGVGALVLALWVFLNASL